MTTTSTTAVSNLDLSVFLLARGVRLVRIEPDAEGRRCVMHFDISDDQLMALESSFLQGAQVAAVQLLASLRQLRRAMDNSLGRTR